MFKRFYFLIGIFILVYAFIPILFLAPLVWVITGKSFIKIYVKLFEILENFTGIYLFPQYKEDDKQ